ncbi:hypothetical protein AGRA3207_004457 [Actinomadura graeca]|uniref:Uncharacterized protein n=1 Tax=Actinomadura graeca TaxID=2750812 RepID=A0ABX8QWU1_9ACTN|nr:hypothetical protein [Actinomadura graeca]QXJ23316.1 hypothetical protein AGRA3207_004457 [Actinomadura graeca]
MTNVLSSYITGLLTNKQTERNRAELVTLIEGRVKEEPELENKQAVGLAVREFDLIIDKDRDLTWHDDRLVIRPSGRIRKSLPSPQQALDELVASVAARRRELGLPLSGEEPPGPPPDRPAEEPDGAAGTPAEGDLIPAEQTPPKPDLRAEVLGLPTEVMREKERRRRESGRD